MSLKKPRAEINNIKINPKQNNTELDKLLAEKEEFKIHPLKNTLALNIDDRLSNLGLNDKQATNILDNITFFTYNPLYKPFEENAPSIGIVNLKSSENPIARYHIPVYKLVTKKGAIFLPSLPLATVMSIIPDNEKKPFIIDKNKIILGKRIIDIDNEGKLAINWHGKGGPGNTYKHISVAKVLLTDAFNRGQIKNIDKNDTISPDIFKNKIVVIGMSAAGTDILPTPMQMNYPGSEIIATCIDNLLNDTNTLNQSRRKFVQEAPFIVNFLIFLFFCSIVGIFNIRSKNNYLSIICIIATIVLFVIYSFNAFIDFRYWTNMTYPVIAITITAISTYWYRTYIINKEKKEIKSVFGMYVSPDVLNELLRNPKTANKITKRKRMTVLFSDIRGFTTLSENTDPQALVDQLREYFNEMVDVVMKHGGTLDKFIGDAVMAFWGDPLPMEDHALRAVLAANEMLERLEKLNQKWIKENKEPLNIGIGINTGEMIVGHLGAQRIGNYTVIGDSVNLASRVESLTKDFQVPIIITEFTYEDIKSCEDFISITYLDVAKVKGKEQLVKIYSINGVSDKK